MDQERGAGRPDKIRPGGIRLGGIRLGAVTPAGWWLDGLMVGGFVAVTLALAWIAPVRRLDLAVLHWADGHRPHGGIAEHLAGWLNRLGQGGALTVLTLIVALILIWRTRSPRPLAPVAAAFIATGAVLLPVKLLFHRAAPHAALPGDLSGALKVRLFSQPGVGLSYPSGHAVNTIVWYGVLALLLSTWLAARPRARAALRSVPPVVVAFTATYLGYHWLTDMLAGLFIGVLLDRLLTRTLRAHRADRASIKE